MHCIPCMRCLICVSLGDADPSPRPERLVVDNGCKGMNRPDHGPEKTQKRESTGNEHRVEGRQTFARRVFCRPPLE